MLKRPLSAKSLTLRPGAQTVDAQGESHRGLGLKNQPLSFPIVGVGASAGGLEAFTQLLKHLPLDTGMGFVLVQHLDPQHESALTHILTRATSMPVQEATNNLRVEANHVYIIPPNTSLGITKGVLKLQPRPPGRMPTRSIDTFFESLAQDQRERAIGVILSGTATDGTLGLEAIKAEGGITFAQDDSARYDSMPRNAVAAGCVDFVLKPEDIANELARIAKHPYVADQSLEFISSKDLKAPAGETPLPSGGPGTLTTKAKSMRGQAETEHAQGGEDGFKKILLPLRNHSGVDFSLYKSTTIHRRIARRTVLSKQNTLEEYSRFLKGNAKELDALYSDVLINVTSFFRNPDAFDILKGKVFPKLLQQRGNDPLRVWVLGCSTGQEAYSITMAFTEAAENAPRARKLQVFATDLNDALLDKARHGLYAKTLAEDVSPDRLRRFFVEEEAGYRIIKPLREMVVFARQNVISDPPFSRMGLISCRNLLIYLEPSLQKKVIPTFHYALKPGGFLFLGGSESVSGFTDLFEPADKKHKIYSKKAAPAQTLHLPVKKERGEIPRGVRPPLPIGKERPEPREGFGGELNAQREADRVSVNQFVPPGVLINAELQIVQFRGPTGAYLQPPSTGKASFDVLKMAREGLMLPLRSAIKKARKENKTTRKENVRVQQDGKSRVVNLEVIPLKNLRERCFLILFEDAERRAWSSSEEARPRRESRTMPPVSKKEEPRRINALETELSETRDYLQSVQEQHEAANEELQASNEEVQSANEELQSVNEELETSKEELESANEELTTVNEEMANRNTELNHLNADLSNLQTSTKLPIVLLGRDLIIRRFSASAEKIFNLLAADRGRPLSGVRHNLVIPKAESAIPGSLRAANESKLRDENLSPYPIENLIREVIDTVREQEQEVRDRDGRWYSLRVKPYMAVDNKVDGAVLVLVDITDLKRSEQEIKDARNYAEATIRTARDPLLVLRADLRVNTANEAFYKTFKLTPAQAEGSLIFDLSGGAWRIPKLQVLLEDILPRNSFFNDFEVTHDFPQIGRRTMLFNARRLDTNDSVPRMILVSIEDVTERLESRTALRESEERYRALFDLNPTAVYTIDTSGVIQNFNRHAAELWGRQPVPGDTDQRFCGSFKMFRPDGSFMPHDQCPMAEVVSGKIAAVHDAEVHIERPNGSRVIVVVNIRPLKNDLGEVIGAINCFYDITERKQAAERVRVSEIRYRRLFETAHDGVLIIDSVSRRITDANPFILDLLGYTREELLGKELWEISLIKDEQASHAVFRQLQQYGMVRYDDLPLQTKAGEKLDVEVVANHYKEDSSPVIQCNVRNITGRKRSEKDLAESLAREKAAHRAKDDFLAALSHELRTPLNPVLLLASDSAIDPEIPPQIRANFDTIRKNIELEARLIDDLLDLTRITHGKLIIHQSEHDVHEIVKDAVSNVLNEIEHKRINLKLDLRAERNAIFGDAVRLQQVFWNVLKNAVKFTSESGQIIVESQTLPDDKILINITDTGIGMSPDEIEHIFGAFSQGSHHFGGLGLGLAISRAIVELHSGSIHASSPGKGKGATLSIELPLIPPSEKGKTISSRPTSTSMLAGSIEKKSEEHPHILLVEDHEPTRSTLTQLLLQRHYQVTSANSFAQACSLMEKNLGFELLISDIGLPDGSGFDLMSKFQKKCGAKGIALTGYGTERDVAHSQSSGFTAHLTKPVSVESLENALAVALNATAEDVFIKRNAELESGVTKELNK